MTAAFAQCELMAGRCTPTEARISSIRIASGLTLG